MQVDTVVEGFAVDLAAGDAVGEGIEAGDAAVGIEISELARLQEPYRSAVVGRAGDQLIAAASGGFAPGGLTGRSIVVLARSRAVDEPVAFFPGFVVQQNLRDAAPIGEGVLAALAPLMGKPL